MTDSAPDPFKPVYVGFWLRMLAFVIDNIPLLILFSLILPLFFDAPEAIDIGELAGLGPMGLLQAVLATALQADSLAQTLLTAAIFIGFWMYFAATPGKMVFGAHIVDAKTFKRASNAQLIIRYLGYYVSVFTLFLGFIWIAFDRRKQGFHDKLAGTVVIKGQPLHDD